MTKKIVVENESEEAVEKKGGFVVVADFEMTRNFQAVQYKAGESFIVPEGWTRDAAFEEFRKINIKGATESIAFLSPLPVLDEKGKLKFMDSRRVILPLKEV